MKNIMLAQDIRTLAAAAYAILGLNAKFKTGNIWRSQTAE